ncbi:MAG: post-transcriptional regulator [Vagococcus sp.]
MTKKLSKGKRWLLRNVTRQQANSLSQLGYPAITEEDIMDYLVLFRWKQVMPDTLEKMKHDVMCVTVNDYYDYQQWRALTSKEFHDLDLL